MSDAPRIQRKPLTYLKPMEQRMLKNIKTRYRATGSFPAFIITSATSADIRRLDRLIGLGLVERCPLVSVTGETLGELGLRPTAKGLEWVP